MAELQSGLRVLADETRFKIVTLLLAHNSCVGALARNLGISNAAVSQHLRLLREAGLVKGEKQGYWTHYAVEREKLIEMGQELIRLGTERAPLEPACRRGKSTTLSGEREKELCDGPCRHPGEEKPEFL